MAVFNEKHCSRPALVLSCIGKRPPPAADVLPELFGGGGGGAFELFPQPMNSIVAVSLLALADRKLWSGCCH